MLYLVLLIDPWEKSEGKSDFVQQALEAFLLLMERIAKEDIEDVVVGLNGRGKLP